METEASLVRAANRNFLGSFRKLTEHVPGGSTRTFGDIFGFRSGLPIRLFNGCVAHRPSSASEFADALGWIEAVRIPHLAWIREDLTDGLAPIAQHGGLEQEAWLTPQMILGTTAEAPAPAPGISVRPVTDASSLEAFLGVLAAGGMTAAVASRMISPGFAADPDVVCLVACLDERPVGTSIAIRTGDVSGVYGVGTLREARRQGVGKAATWAAVAAGRGWGCETIVLQSTEMGFPMYDAMGFKTVVRYAVFAGAG